MRILYIGNFSANSPGEPEIAESLEELGHQVTKINEWDVKTEELEGILKREKFDFLLFAKLRVKGNVREFLEKVKIPKICWVFDLYFGLHDET